MPNHNDADACPDNPCERAERVTDMRENKLKACYEVLKDVTEMSAKRNEQIKDWLTFSQEWMQGQKELLS